MKNVLVTLPALLLLSAGDPVHKWNVIDGHNDAPYSFRQARESHKPDPDLSRDTSANMHTDIPRMRRGQMGAQFWSAYMSSSYTGSNAVKVFKEQIETVHSFVAKYKDDFEMAPTAADVERIMAAGKIASLIGVESGHAINSSLDVLRQFYARNVRYMTLTHSLNNEWADSATDPNGPKFRGLSAFGKQVVLEMNKLGMLVDLSHVSDDVMRQSLDISRAPVIFSHSSVRALCNHKRNVPDDVLARLPQNGGVVMINFYAGYISEEVRRRDELREKGIAPDENGPEPVATLSQVADHIDYLKNKIGVEHIGIGGDYDGVEELPVGLEDVSKYPALFAELEKRGYSQDDLDKIAHGNILRALKDAERVSRELSNE